MTRSIMAHFDGKVIVPDEPVDLPVNEPLRVDMTVASSSIEEVDLQERLRRLELTIGGVKAPPIPPEALRRENLYDD